MLRGRETVGGGHGMVKRYVFEDEGVESQGIKRWMSFCSMADGPRTRVKRAPSSRGIGMMMLFWFTGVPFRVRDMGNSWVWGKLSLLLSQVKALVVTG